jgi:hypothetical protein
MVIVSVRGSTLAMTSDEEQRLWEWAVKLDETAVTEFATGIVGIGALFFAYGQVAFVNTRILIALIGLGGSIILWLHLYATRKDIVSIRNELNREKGSFVVRLSKLQAWRNQGRNRVLYYPVSRLMTYFMGLVSWGWIVIVIRRLNWFSFGILELASILILLFMVALTGYRQVEDKKRKT